MFPFVVLDDGARVPEAYSHDVSILPHQHEGLEELFPQAHVPTAADADEALSEADCLEQRGTELGRRGAKEALSCMAASWRRAMAPQATSVACVHPSIALQNEKTDTEKDKKNDNENLQGRLLRQNPSRAMTPQATSAACVSPWRSHRHGGARGKRPCPSGKTTAVAGTYAVQIGSPTTGRSKTTGTASSFLQESTRGSAGKPGCSRACRHAPTVAFELLRLLEHLVQ